MLTEVGFVALALWSCTNRERIPALGVAAHQIRGDKVSSDRDLQGASYCSNVIPRANRVGGRDFGCTLCDLGSRASPCLVPQILEIEAGRCFSFQVRVSTGSRLDIRPTTAPQLHVWDLYISARAFRLAYASWIVGFSQRLADPENLR